MAQNESYQEHERKKYFAHILEEKLIFIITIPLLAILTTTFIFHFYRVDGSSMEQTFQDDDLLLVEKVGKTTSSIFRKNYTPNRYDVVVFKEPRYDEQSELVKRVIGLPGDRVVIRNKNVTVYNEQNPNGIEIDRYIPSEADVVEISSSEKLEVNVKSGEVFVLGDNRPGSDDSRYFGPIKTENIIGKVIVRLLPFDDLLIL